MLFFQKLGFISYVSILLKKNIYLKSLAVQGQEKALIYISGIETFSGETWKDL